MVNEPRSGQMLLQLKLSTSTKKNPARNTAGFFVSTEFLAPLATSWLMSDER